MRQIIKKFMLLKKKTAIAKVIIKTGKGKITLNGRDYNTLHIFDKLNGRTDKNYRINYWKN